MFKDNKILILGLARSGYSAAKILIERGNEVILNDSKEEEKLDKDQISELRELGVKLIFGSHPDDLLDNSFDYLIKNPGVPNSHKYVVKAQELGIEVLNEVEMTYRLLPDDIKIIGITGTNGKTTTTSLTYEIMKSAFGDKVHLAGNIGYPFCSILNDLVPGDIVVMEVSCQQLNNMSTYKPDVALMTNLSPAHIDFFGTYEKYKEVKARLFKNQTSTDVAILNIDNDDVIDETKDIKSTVKYFSSTKEINGCYLKDGAIYYYGDKVIDTDKVFIAGRHNLENCMGAIMIAKEFDVSNEVIEEVISNFRGVEHRLEYVDTVSGRLFYNDTEATNIKCCQIALSSFKQPTILFLGGYERNQDFNELTDFVGNVKAIMAIGSCRNRVKEFGDKMNIPTYQYEFLKDAFKMAWNISEEGDILLLSPASASWDQYKECEERGAEFKKYVHEINTCDNL